MGDAEIVGGVGGVGQGEPFVEVRCAVAVEVEGAGVLRDGGGGGEGFPDEGVEVGERAGFIRAEVGRADDGEAALVAGDGAAGGGVARGAAGLEGHGLGWAAVIVERGEEWGERGGGAGRGAAVKAFDWMMFAPCTGESRSVVEVGRYSGGRDVPATMELRRIKVFPPMKMPPPPLGGWVAVFCDTVH